MLSVSIAGIESKKGRTGEAGIASRPFKVLLI